jgi:hypothetical protein
MSVPVGLRRLVSAPGARGGLRKEPTAPSRAGRTAGPGRPLAEEEGGDAACGATAGRIPGVAPDGFDTPGRRPAASRPGAAGAAPQPLAGFLRKNGFLIINPT